MLKIKVLSIILILTMTLGVLGGCGGSNPETKPAESNKASDSGKMVDGVYKVEFDSFDSHDYKPQLELTVKDGKITEVKYDEIGKDGKLKSQDEQYKKKMEEASGNYPEKAYKELEQQLITKQSSNIDAVAGATASSKTFTALVKYALDEKAKKGDTSPGKIALPK